MAIPWSQDLYIEAYRYAVEAHSGQLIPGTDLPYIVHVSLVSMEMISALANDHRNLDGNLAIQCALLHDTIEDTNKTYDEIRSIFGHQVAEGVNALTKRKMFGTKQERMRDSLQRIKNQPIEVWMVKMADRITNLQPPPANWTDDMVRQYKSEALLVHDELKEASGYLAERLLGKIERYPDDDRKLD